MDKDCSLSKTDEDRQFLLSLPGAATTAGAERKNTLPLAYYPPEITWLSVKKYSILKYTSPKVNTLKSFTESGHFPYSPLDVVLAMRQR